MDNKSTAQYEALIDKMAAGDKDALSSLYGFASAAVFGFALSIVKNTQDAEDILQDTFVSIFSSARYYKKMGKPMAWILTIAKNTAFMKLREQKKSSVIPEDEWNLFIADDTRVTSEERIVLTAALGKIPPEESQIVMLHASAGFKHREIAELLELPLSTVLSKYNRAVKKLKSVLKGSDPYGR